VAEHLDGGIVRTHYKALERHTYPS
jgi:hypothetical protein